MDKAIKVIDIICSWLSIIVVVSLCVLGVIYISWCEKPVAQTETTTTTTTVTPAITTTVSTTTTTAPTVTTTTVVEDNRPHYIGTFKLTAYCACETCCGEYANNRPLDASGNPIIYTASGAIAKADHTIAVDPSVIAYGTAVIINGEVYVAEDTGGAINGNHIDIYFEDHQEALAFGLQYADVHIIS